MSDPTIKCPKCNAEIRLDESLAQPLVLAERARFNAQLKAKEDELAAKLREQRAVIVAEEARKARDSAAQDLAERTREAAEMKTQLAERDRQIEERNRKLDEAQKAQAEAMRMQRVLDDERRELGVTVERKVREGLDTARAQARKDAEQAIELKLAESEQTNQSLRKTIAELQRKAEQGSQQLQGEVLELQLESQLRERFPFDVIEPISKGELGADALQRVRTNAGQPAGAILWESKRTKNWQDAWLPKLRGDQRAARAELAVIVSVVLPAGVESFGCIEGVWVVSPRHALPLAEALRQGVLEVASARRSGDGQNTKMEQMYTYLTGTQFRQRVEALIEAYTELREDLDKERKAIQKIWARREMQLERMITTTAGMYGDLQGIAGRSLQEIKGLDIAQLGDEGAQKALPHADNGSSLLP